MIVYILLFIYEVIACAIYDTKCINKTNVFRYNNKKVFINYKALLWLMILVTPLWLVMGLRYRIGIDYNNYESIFWIILQNGNIDAWNIEWGYRLVNEVVAFFTNEPQMIFIVTSLIICLLYVIAVRDSKVEMALAIVAFMGLGNYFYSMNLVRQYIAIAIIFCSYPYWEQNKSKKYVIMILLASLFHTSALICFPIRFLLRKFETKKFCIIITLSFLSVRLLINVVISFLIRFGIYEQHLRGSNSFTEARTSYWNILLSVGILVLLFMERNCDVNNFITWSSKVKMVWVLLCSYLFLNVLGDAAIRCVLYFTPVYLLVIGDSIKLFSMKSRTYARMFIICIMFALMIFWITYEGNSAQNFVPYKTRY